MSKSFRLGAVLGVLLCAIPLSAGWRERYPLYGGAVAIIAVDAGGDVYAVGSGGLFRFNEGTLQWTSALGDLPTTAIAVLTPDPVQVGTLYAGTDKGLYRTADSGSTWTRLPLNLPGGIDITAIVVAPANTDRLFVATWGSYVWRSLDRGATWSQSASGLSGGWSGPAFISTIAADPTNADRLYTNTWRGRLFRSDDAAATWIPIADSSTWTALDIQVSRSHPNVLYMTHDEYWFGRGTVLRSSDYGSSWTNAGRPAPYVSAGTNIGKPAIHPTDPNTVYVTAAQGLYRTTTGGGTWTRVFYPSGPTYLASVAIDAGTPARVFTGSAYSGFYRTTNGGLSWSQQNDGMAAATFAGLDLCRDVPSTIYAVAQGTGYVKSTDAGDTWSPVAAALNGQSYGGLAVHPQNPNIFVTASGDGAVSRTWRSTDGGATVAQTSINYGPWLFRFNPLDPSYVHGPISDWQGGFLRSADSGASFSVPYWWYIYPNDFAFHPTHPNIVFSVAYQYTGAAQNTLWIVWSNNYGASWTGTTFGRGGWYELALDQNAPGTLYAVGRMPSEGTEGAYKFNVSYSGPSVTGITRVPGTFNNGLGSTALRMLHYDKANGWLYASTPNGVYRTGDQMQTWTSINEGLQHRSTNWLAGTPDGEHLYVTTSGGIWEYSDALPVPVATPVVRSTPSDLLQTFVTNMPKNISVLGETTTAADTIVLTSSALAPNMTFTATAGNPAAGTFTFAPAPAQRGQTYEISFTATSTLEPAKSHTISHYLSVIGDAGTDAAALIGAGSDGTIKTPDGGNFSLDIPAGAIPSLDVAAVNVAYESNYKQADVNAHLPGQRPGKITLLSAYDITINGLDHFTFALPVALTFHYDEGVDPANIIVITYNETTRNFEPRTDTSCLAYFGRQPVTGSMAAGGTVSICTSTVSIWATADVTTYVNVDTTPPAISIAVPADGTVYLLNQPVTASYTCTDEESGVATCTATAIDTATAGAHTFTVTATDHDGNAATASSTYFVRYAFSGFLPPLKSTAKAGQVIPLKWQLRDAAGAFIGNLATIASLQSAPIACGATPKPFTGEPATYPGNALPRYDVDANQYIVNWQTRKEWSGCRALQLTLDDGARYFLVIEF